jgi:AraC-like DNA-binding protein
MTATPREKELYGQGIEVRERSGAKTVYRLDCGEGEGKMTAFKLFPGVDLLYSEFFASTCFQNIEPLPHIMEINHCRKGRFECEFKRGSYAYLGEGGFAVNMLGNQAACSRFPLGFYQGVSILVDIRLAQEMLAQAPEGVAIDLDGLREKLCPQNCCLVLKAPLTIEHIFAEIYRVDPKIQLGYLRLKTLELLLVLSVLPPPDISERSPYFSAGQVQKVKHIREHLTASLDQAITLKELANEHDISLTGLKNCFKAIYGKTVYAFRREYRMQAAAEMLRDTSLTITEIAGLVGYENPGKFSAAFKEIMGLTPGAYRQK